MEIINRIMRAWPRLTAVSLGLILVLVLVGLLELFFGLLNRQPRGDSHITMAYSRKFHQPDEQLGYKPIPLVQVKATKKMQEKIIYETSYAFDASSRRITPVGPPLHRQKFIAFWGCSLTFGEGVKEDETIPFYAGQLAPDYRPYNYGFSGYGPQQMLAKLQQEGWEQELPEGKGVLIFTFIGPHIMRAVGSMQVYLAWSHNMPYYALNPQDELVRKGNFTTGRPLLSLLYAIIGKSQFAKYFQVDFPPKMTADHIHLTARIIEESCRIFQRRFPGSEFCLVIYPGYDQLNEVIPELRQTGVKVLNYNQLWDPHNLVDYVIANDGHPSPYANSKLAAHIVQDLNLRHPEKQPE